MLTTDTHGDYVAPWGGGHGIPLRDQEAQQEAGGGRGGEQTLLQTVDCGGLSCSSGPGPGRPERGERAGLGYRTRVLQERTPPCPQQRPRCLSLQLSLERHPDAPPRPAPPGGACAKQLGLAGTTFRAPPLVLARRNAPR